MKSTIKLHPFEEKHLPEAGRIALALWGEEYPGHNEAEREAIYRYLPRYYFHRHSVYNWGVSEQDSLCALLLAHEATQQNIPIEPAESGQNLVEYKAYLDGNRAKELQFVREHEVILDFFASTKPGCGRMLMAQLEAACRAKGIESMLLWTDDTCDVSYYYHNGFTEVAKLPTDPPLGDLKLNTYLFRKQF